MGGDGFHDQVVTPLGPSSVEPIFAARLNPSDATEEAWVKIGTGAYAQIVTIFVFQGCELRRPTLDGNPVELAVGASVRNASGVSCFMFDQAIEVFDTTSEDGITFNGQSAAVHARRRPQSRRRSTRWRGSPCRSRRTIPRATVPSDLRFADVP